MEGNSLLIHRGRYLFLIKRYARFSRRGLRLVNGFAEVGAVCLEGRALDVVQSSHQRGLPRQKNRGMWQLQIISEVCRHRESVPDALTVRRLKEGSRSCLS